jgi:non-ribosomal peptide synthetase component F
MMGGRSSPLPELPFQYADYAAWERGRLHSEALDGLSKHFLRRLSGARPLELPADHPRSSSRNARRAAHTFELPPELYQSLKDLSHEEAASLFMTLAAAFHALLVRYAGCGETVLTTRVANRNRAELESLIGPFENAVAVRTDADAELSFKETLVRVRREVVDAFAHQDVPFHVLTRALSQEPCPNESPLLQTTLVLESSPWEEFEAAGLRLGVLAADYGGERCNVELRLTEHADGLSGRWDYNAEMFEPDTIGRMARDYEKLLAGVVAEPERPLYQLWGANEAEAMQAIAGFNDDLESL